MTGLRVPTDPFMAFQFAVAVGSRNATRVIGGFSDVTGLGVESEVETIRVGGMNSADVTLPGPAKFASRLVLKRGMGDPAMLWNWYLKILGGAITRENVMIELRSTDGKTRAAWTFSDACPVKWTGPELHAATSAMAFETLELVHRGFLAPGS